MKTAFIIYCKAVGLYALLTLPALLLPYIYIISLAYVLFYGWFAWALFTGLYLIIDRLLFDYGIKVMLLFISVIVSVAFAFQMLEVLHVEDNVWHAGEFILFPFVAVIGGWISICLSGERIRSSHTIQEQ